MLVIHGTLFRNLNTNFNLKIRANMNKEIESLNIKEVRKLIREAFKHYNRKEIYKEEFYNYFKNKGLTEEEIDDLWLRTIGESKIVKWGIHFEADEIPPKKIKKRQFIKLIR